MISLVNHNRSKAHGAEFLALPEPRYEEVTLGPRHNWRFRDERANSNDNRPGNKITFTVFDFGGLTLNELYLILGKLGYYDYKDYCYFIGVLGTAVTQLSPSRRLAPELKKARQGLYSKYPGFIEDYMAGIWCKRSSQLVKVSRKTFEICAKRLLAK